MPSNKQQHSPEALRAVPHNPPSPLLASAAAIPALVTSVGPKDKPPSPTSRRKPVPSVSADDVDEPEPSPTSTTATAPRPAFQPPAKLVASASSVDVRPSTRRQGAPPLRTSTSDDPISPTNRGEFSRGRAAPPTTPPRGSAQRQRSTSRGPPVPVPQDEDDIATLNFDRRPSQIDPLTPSFHYAHSPASGGAVPPVPSLPGGGAPTPRALTGMTFAPLPPPSPVRSPPTEQRGHMRQRSSHARNPSISLSSPLASPTSASYGPHALPLSSTSSSATSADARSSAKILPLQPARTRAPIEAFASVEMLQGQREHQDRTRGTEVFGPGGTYEGRASSLSGEGGLPAYSRRHDPLAAVHAARNPGLAASQHSQQQQQFGASQLPPLEFDIMSIASQLREHDARRGSEDVRGGEWPRRFSEASSGGDDSPPPTPSGGPTLNPAFSFPTRSTSSLKSAAPTYSSNSELGRAFSFAKRDSAGAGDGPGGWRTEHLGASDKAFALQRPSIVALPVYPAPGGTLGRSFKTRAKKWATKVALVTVLLACASSWVYLWVRLGAMRIVERRRPGVFVGGWCYLALETVVTLLMTVHSIWTVFTYRPRSTDPKLRLRGDHNLPSVDVFVVSSGQADQTVFDCAVAAASMDYPPHRYRVMVLDPLASANLERELTRHAKSQAAPHLSYHRRELGAAPASVVVDSSEEKTPKLMQEGQRRSSGARGIETAANSINFGMVEAASFGIKGPAEFIAVFDADMIPERNYLRAVLPHILGENKVGLVKTRRGFINLPHRVNQPTATLLTACETPADTRSGFLLRRAALTEIGGFPAASWIHDGQCEALLQGRGYQVQQVDEVLQWGMAKPTYASQIGAMMVNRLGPLRTAHRLGWFIRGDKTRLMPFGARLKAIGKALLPLFSVVVLLLAYVYPFMFTFGGILVLTPNLSNLNRLLQVTLIMVLLHKLHEAVWCWSTGLPSPRRVLQAWIFAAPYQGVALARLILPRRLGGYKARTSDLDINEVVAHPVRDKWYKRLGWAAIDPLVSTMFAFLAAFGVAIWRIVRDYEHGTTDRHQALLTVLLTIAWPTLLWSEFLFASFVPFVCLLFPSHLLTEPRESFLIRDHYSHVARPKHHFKTASPFKVSRAPEFVTGVVVVAWAVVCVCVAKLTDVLA